MGIPRTIKLSSPLASEMRILRGTENHAEKGRVSRSTNTHIGPPPRFHGAGFRPERLQLWMCTHILWEPWPPSSPSPCRAQSALPRPRPLSDSARPHPSGSRPAQGPGSPRGSALPLCGTPPTGSGNASADAGTWPWRHARVSGRGRRLRAVAVVRGRGLLVCRCRCPGVATR